MTNLPIPPIPSGALNYLEFAGVAFCGSFLRANKWRDEITGKIIWSRILTEIPVAIAIGGVAAGVGAYKHLDPAIVGGIAGLLGLLGAAFFTGLNDAVISILKAKLGNG